MKVQCPNCRNAVVAKGIGRKPLNIPLKNICESLQAHHSVKAAAQRAWVQPELHIRRPKSQWVETAGRNKRTDFRGAGQSNEDNKIVRYSA
jgi:hypothetical protein